MMLDVFTAATGIVGGVVSDAATSPLDRRLVEVADDVVEVLLETVVNR